MTDNQPSSVANFIESSSRSGNALSSRPRVELDVRSSRRHCFYSGLDEVSPQGIFIGTHVQRPVGETFEVAITLPDSDEPIVGICEVRWIREYGEDSDADPGMGLKFVELSEAAASRIKSFLNDRDTLFFDE